MGRRKTLTNAEKDARDADIGENLRESAFISVQKPKCQVARKNYNIWNRKTLKVLETFRVWLSGREDLPRASPSGELPTLAPQAPRASLEWT
mgnify:CR=1 FL=1